jgi:probable HAF family extracellular repeat protein
MGGSEAYAVSADGSTIVGDSSSLSGMQAFRWREGAGMEGLGYLNGGALSEAWGVSGDGAVVVGRGKSASPVTLEAFIWTPSGGMQGLGFLGSFRGRQPLSEARAVSGDGSVVVGGSSSPLGIYAEAFRWTESEGMQGLGFGYGYASEARGVSEEGSVVVGSIWSDFGEEAFIWDVSHGMRRLQDVLTSEYNIDLTGWTLNCATGVSSDGMTIVGYGRNPDWNAEGWIARLGEPTVIPAPGAIILGCIGTGLVGWLRRRGLVDSL